MPMENDSNETDISQGSKKPCSGLRQELKDCILASECVQKHGLTPHKCLNFDVGGVDDACRRTQFLFYECKRSLLDFRNRFRGRKGY